MVRSKLRGPLIALSAGTAQAGNNLSQLVVTPMAALLGLGAGLSWVTTSGYVLPVLVGLFMAGGDWFGGRRLILWLAGVTCAGDALEFAGAVLAAAHDRDAAIGLVAAGLVLMPTAVRMGAVLIAYETHGMSGEQVARSRGLRRYLIPPIYLMQLPAGFVANQFGWAWVFGPIVALQFAGIVVLAKQIPAATRHVPEAGEPPRPSFAQFMRELAGELADRPLLFAASGAFFAQWVVFGYVAGQPVWLDAEGLKGWISVIVAGGVLAAPFVTRPKLASPVRFGRWAGALPVAGLSALEMIALLAGVVPPDVGVILSGVTAGLVAAPVAEASKQFAQTTAQLAATAAADRRRLYRRQAVVNLGSNLGALCGTLVGHLTAPAGTLPWIGLLLGLAAVAWAIQAGWFVLFPHPWKVQGAGPGRERWCYRGREFVVDVGGTLGGVGGVIYEAADRSDKLLLARVRAVFDPNASTVEDQLRRLELAPGRLYGFARDMLRRVGALLADVRGWLQARAANRRARRCVRLSGLGTRVHLWGLRIAGVDGAHRALLRALQDVDPARLRGGQAVRLPRSVSCYEGSVCLLRRGPSAFVVLPVWRRARTVIVGPWSQRADLIARAIGLLSAQSRREVRWASRAERALLHGGPQWPAAQRLLRLVGTTPDPRNLPRPSRAPHGLLAYREFGGGVAVAVIDGPAPRVYAGFSPERGKFWQLALERARQEDRRRARLTGWRALDRATVITLALLTAVQGAVGAVGLYVFSDLLPDFARTIHSASDAGWIPAAAQVAVTAALVVWQWVPALGRARTLAVALLVNAAALAAMTVTHGLPGLVLEAGVAGATTISFMVAGSLIAQLAHARARVSAGIVSGLVAVALGIGSLVRWVLIGLGQAFEWPLPLGTLAVLALISALVLRRARLPKLTVHAASRARAGRWPRGCWRVLGLGAAVVFLGALADAAVVSYQSVALTFHGDAAAVGPFASLLFVGAVLGGIIVNATAKRRLLAVPAATAAVVVGALACWTTQPATGVAWLIWEIIGRLLLDTGANVFALSLPAVYADHFGAPERFVKVFALARALAAALAALITVTLWAAGGWAAITAFAAVIAGLLVAATPWATLALRERAAKQRTLT